MWTEKVAEIIQETQTKCGKRADLIQVERSCCRWEEPACFHGDSFNQLCNTTLSFSTVRINNHPASCTVSFILFSLAWETSPHAAFRIFFNTLIWCNLPEFPSNPRDYFLQTPTFELKEWICKGKDVSVLCLASLFVLFMIPTSVSSSLNSVKSCSLLVAQHMLQRVGPQPDHWLASASQPEFYLFPYLAFNMKF